MLDFTIKLYRILLETLTEQGFSFVTFRELLSNPGKMVVVLRHDVDKLPLNSLLLARIQHKMGIKVTYYFRAVQESWNDAIIKELADMGHEVGYHYEDMNRYKVHGRMRYVEEALARIAIESFAKNLENLRLIAPVKTICMHGSPIGRWDSRLLWKYYDFKDFGIIGEPYFNVNFEEILYLTDTGRKWNGNIVSVRDKASENLEQLTFDKFSDWKVKPVRGSLMNMTIASSSYQNKYLFRSTYNIIRAAERGELPDRMMITFHPQRWTDKPVRWIKELVWQNIKNVGKYFVIRLRNN